jgi:hypothetical protein
VREKRERRGAPQRVIGGGPQPAQRRRFVDAGPEGAGEEPERDDHGDAEQRAAQGARQAHAPETARLAGR